MTPSTLENKRQEPPVSQSAYETPQNGGVWAFSSLPKSFRATWEAMTESGRPRADHR